MKRTLLITVLLVALAFNAAADTNFMGLSAFPPDYWLEPCVEGPGQQVYNVYLFIYNPVNPDFGTAGESRVVQNINGFECRVWAEGDATILDWHFLVDAIDAGTNGNTVVGFAEPVPVTGIATIIATLDIFAANPSDNSAAMIGDLKSSPMPCDEPTAFVNMAPTRPTQSIEGTMAYLDADDPDDPLVAAYILPFYNYNDVIMAIQTYPVDTEDQTWGAVKALYR
jgi:hypothetical protein